MLNLKEPQVSCVVILPKHSLNVVAALTPCIFAFLIYAMFRFSIGLALPELMLEYNLTHFMEGQLIALQLLAATVTTGLAGFLSDRIGAKTVLITGVLLYSLFLIAAVAAPNYILLLILLTISGLGAGLMLPPVYILAGELLPRSRGSAIGAVGSFYNIGGLIGPIFVGNYLLSGDWRTPLIWIGVIGLVSAVAQSILVKQPKSVRADKVRGAATKILQNRNILILGLSILIADSAFVGFVTWAPTFLRQDLLMSPDEAGYLFGASTAIGALGIVLMGYLQDRVDGKKVILANSLTSAILTFTLLTQRYKLLTAPILLLSGFFMNCFWTLISAQAQKSVKEGEIGSATGIVQNLGMLGAIIGPALIGWLTEMMTLSLALIIAVSGFYLISSSLIFLYKHQVKPRS